MKLYQLIAASLLTLMVLAGCTTTGMGRGEMTAKGESAEPVLFKWKSMDGGLSGTMTAILPDAIYTGRFFQITRQTTREALVPMWNGWNEGWSDWPYWGEPYPDTYGATQFITYYSGKVVANLETSGGRHMRCRFNLVDPRSGMAGGGQGECQLSGGGVINATF
ncbi:MAG: hypothetical protein ACP5SG_00165 [Dissulfurimicrobium sp.]|uniref:hypothetical protein n=1 Tax=Dissulfurimicrobium TaxID=1769732 RepID=UPI003C769ADE